MVEQFIGAAIQPVAGTFDTIDERGGAGASSAVPVGVADRRVARVLKSWRETGPCHHGSGDRYVRKHWYEVLTDSGETMTIYFERQPRVRSNKSRWWLFTVSGRRSRAVPGEGGRGDTKVLSLRCRGFRSVDARLPKLAGENGMEIVSCAEEIDLRPFGILPGKCVDNRVIAEAFGVEVPKTKDPTQRAACGCVVSRDIGMYESCLFGCQYCYATKSFDQARANFESHDPNSLSLLGWHEPPERVPG